jgi:hypothetical protein
MEKKHYLIIVSILSLIVLYLFFDKYELTEKNSQNYLSNDENIVDTSAIVDIESIERKKVNDQLYKKNLNYRNNWSDYIKVATEYQYNDLGGIYSPKVTLKNDTEYIIDNINIELQYIKDNGEVYKTENLTFSNVQPYSLQTLDAPDSNRGTKLVEQILSIHSDKMNFCYDLYQVTFRNNEDPYFCK